MMLAIVGVLLNFLTWAAVEIAARWGLRVALTAMVIACYVAAYAFIATVFAFFHQVGAHPFLAFLLQFFPSSSAIIFAATVYWGTMGYLRAYAYCKDILVNVSRIPS